MKPSAGTVTSAPIAAPMPSVESSRKTLRGYRSGSSGPSSSSAASSETGSSATTARLGSRPDVAGHIADPGEAEEECEDAPGDREPPVDDQPDEDEGDPAREGEGEDRRGREVLLGILVGRLSRPL